MLRQPRRYPRSKVTIVTRGAAGMEEATLAGGGKSGEFEDVYVLSCIPSAFLKWCRGNKLADDIGLSLTTLAENEYSKEAFDYSHKNNIKSTYLMTEYANFKLKRT